MNFIDRLLGRRPEAAPRMEPQVPAPQTEAKYSAAGPIISQRVVGKPVWTNRDYASLAEEAYLINSVSFRCVSMIASCAAGIPLLLFRGDEELAEHPILELLKRPSPTQGGKAFLRKHLSYHLLAGNGYMEAVGPRNGPPLELWTQRPDRMNIIAGRTGLPQAFEYKIGSEKKRWLVNQVTGQCDILHTKEFNPIDDWYGMSRLEAAAYGVDRHNAASRHNKALLDNGARPSGALVFEPIQIDGNATHAPKEVIEAAEKELMDRHGGPENAGKPMTFGGAVKWVEMGVNPKDMDFDRNKDDAARDICIAWGVPHTLVVKGQSTYNNVSEAKLELYEDNVIPLLGEIVDELNVWLCPRFGDGFALKPDLDAISALEERRVARRKSVTDLMDKQVIDEDEGREMLGYGPRSAEAVKKVDASVLQALIGGVEIFGIQPLARYMRSVGLVAPGTSDDQILSDALNLLESDPEEEPITGEEDDDVEL